MLRLKVRRQALREVGKAFAVGFMAAAVVWLTSGVPVVSQQVPQLPTRDQIIQGLEQALAVTLVAAEGDIFDVDNTFFGSGPRLTWSFTPLHPKSPSLEVLKEWLDRGAQSPIDPVSIGAIYLENDIYGIPGFLGLKAGVYTLKITNDFKLLAVDRVGNKIPVGFVRVEKEGNPVWKIILIAALICAQDGFLEFKYKTENLEITGGC